MCPREDYDPLLYVINHFPCADQGGFSAWVWHHTIRERGTGSLGTRAGYDRVVYVVTVCTVIHEEGTS